MFVSQSGFDLITLQLSATVSVRMFRFIRNLPEWTFVKLIRFYQIGISPLIGPSCRYTPTCSQYAIDAIRKYGPISGMYRAIKRILRCHPWHPGGHDPP